ncbi:ImmA/IrrE family metallo-endopeptidase [Natronospora cellulosivora (SeqCode)]
MDGYNEIIEKNISKLRQQYDLGNYWGRSLFTFVEKLKLESNRDILLFRLPFNISNISGFVGYKNGQFVIFTNTNKNLGHEVFTLAHEIYHLLENENLIKEEIVINESENKCDYNDEIADKFAAELLMPENKIREDFEQLLEEDNMSEVDERIIIQLQHLYCVDYKAITKRLINLDLIDHNRKESLDEIVDNNELEISTRRLGFNNNLNKPSKKETLPQKFLKAIKENYKDNKINYDDLLVVLGYGNLRPEKFGYEIDNSLSDEAKNFMEQLDKKLGSGNFGKE